MTTDLAFTISGEIKDLKDKAFSRIKTSAKLHKYSHVCSLPPSEDMVVAFINSGHCVYLRRMLRKYSAINNNSKYASDCFKSSKQIEKEMKRHFKHYYCMIHPFSLFTEHFDYLLFVLLMISILLFRTKTYISVHVILHTVFTIEIIRRFMTGIYRESFNDTVMAPKKVAKLYLKTWLFHDILNAIPVQMIANYDLENEQVKYIAFTLFATVLQIARILKIIRVMDNIQKYRRINIYIYKGVRLLIITILLLLWLSYSLLTLMDSNPEEWYKTSYLNNYIMVVERNFAHFFMLGSKYEISEHLLTLIWDIFIILIGYMYRVYADVQFFHFTKLYNASLNSTQRHRSQIEIYCVTKKLPASLVHRINLYYSFRFPQDYYDEQFIQDTCSRHLRKHIAECQSQTFLINVSLFQHLTLYYITKIMMKMKMIIHLPNDIIGKNNNNNKVKHIYVIFYGTVAMYSRTWKELYHLYDNDYFSEEFLTTVNATVVAVDSCKLYKIALEDLQNVLISLPDIYDRIIFKVNDEFIANYEKKLKKEEKLKHVDSDTSHSANLSNLNFA